MSVLSRPGVLRAAWMYPLLAVLGTASFFSLHHLGNLLPYELAEQRFRHEIATTNRVATHPSHLDYTEQWGVRHIVSAVEYCELSLMVLAGALRDGEKPSFVQAVIPRGIHQKIEPYGWHCIELQAVMEGVPLPETIKRTRYQWGSKAFYAIGLFGLSITGLHRLIEIASRVGWVVLAGALLLLGWRAFLVVAPVPVFGSLFSGIDYLSDIANGIPYAWSLFAAALFTCLLSRSRKRPFGAAASALCFVAGMVSSWLWIFDGHEILLITLFGLIGWFGSSHLEPRARFFRVTGFMALYITGFVVCFALIQITKLFVYELFVLGGARDSLAFVPYSGLVHQNLFDTVGMYANRIVREVRLGLTLVAPGKIPIVGDYNFFEIMTAIYGLPKIGTRIIAFLSLVALGVAARRALSRKSAGADARPDFLWLLGLMVLIGLHFILPNDAIFRSGRWIFLLLALSWSCLIAVLIGPAVSARPESRVTGAERV